MRLLVGTKGSHRHVTFVEHLLGNNDLRVQFRLHTDKQRARQAARRDIAFCLKLLEEAGVACAPGMDFDPVDGHRFMRFSFALSTEEIEEGLTRHEPWFKTKARR